MQRRQCPCEHGKDPSPLLFGEYEVNMILFTSYGIASISMIRSEKKNGTPELLRNNYKGKEEKENRGRCIYVSNNGVFVLNNNKKNSEKNISHSIFSTTMRLLLKNVKNVMFSEEILSTNQGSLMPKD
ncbi:hypothetical protein AVEN_177048-1 [Araneus ventricosus]|uniref:Uncharacterized protein n=1 Tax=Araneus ventricosus TaxID=182803 RepID=A0A4Y2CUX4_ARAVE|nr:hypothetical protein AVEN_177048-1 [Araneus ventricosus]